MEVLLGRADAPQLGVHDLLAVRDARRQARGRRLVPGGKRHLVREAADLGLGEARVAQRALDAQLGERPQARAVVGEVVHVGALGQVLDAARGHHHLYLREERTLAQVAAVGTVVGEARHLELVEGDRLVADVLRDAELVRAHVVGDRDAVHARRDREHVVAEGVAGDLGEQRGVDAARERHRDASERAEVGPEGLELVVDAWLWHGASSVRATLHQCSRPSCGALAKCRVRGADARAQTCDNVGRLRRRKGKRGPTGP